jgi:hypothetical protein
VPPCGDPSYTLPVVEYGHDAGRCSVTGGYVYRGVDVPDLYGMYVYGDFCSGEMWAATPQPGTWPTPVLLPFSAPNLTTFGEDALGELYAGTQDGHLYRFAPTAVLPVSVDAISPDSGLSRGGQRVTISGTNFNHSTQVFFGASPAVVVQVESPFALVALAPSAGPGTVDVTVVNPGTAPVIRPGAFTYTPFLRVAPPSGTRTLARPVG